MSESEVIVSILPVYPEEEDPMRMTSGSANSPFQFRTYQCAHCRIFFPETTDYCRFLCDGLNLLESDNPFKERITILQVLTQVYGKLLSPLLTQELCLCETCESELRQLFGIFVKFGKKENSLLIKNIWENDVPNEKSTQTDFVPNEEQGESILGVANEIHIHNEFISDDWEEDMDGRNQSQGIEVDTKPVLLESSSDITGWRIIQKPSPRSRQLVNPFPIVSSKTELLKKYQGSDSNFAFVKIDTSERILADETLNESQKRVTRLSVAASSPNKSNAKVSSNQIKAISTLDSIVDEEDDDDMTGIADDDPCEDPEYEPEPDNKPPQKKIRSIYRQAELKKKRRPYPSEWKCFVKGCKEEKPFATETMLLKHKLTAHNISRRKKAKQKFTCSFPSCDKVFFQRSHNYIYHQNSHLPPEERVEIPKRPHNFKCEFPGCGKTFEGRRSLSKHTNSHLPPEEKRRDFPCPQCGKRCISSDALKSHIRMHTDEKRALCTDCGKSFRSNSGLKQHMEIHKNSRLHKCQECGRGFNNPANLVAHCATAHSEERPFTCDHCGKSYKTLRQLRAHQAKSCGVEYSARYACDICKIACQNASLLQQHRLTHAPDYGRILVCQTCKQSFLSEEELAVHEEVHKYLYKCIGPGCKESFKTRVDLRYHLLEFHKVDKERVYDWVRDPSVKLFE